MKNSYRSLFLAMLLLGLYHGGGTGCDSGVPVNISFQLDVEVVGNGAVTSSPAGIDCGMDCSQEFLAGTQIILTAVAAPGSQFSGWSGGTCSGNGDCNLDLNGDAQITANFVRQVSFNSSAALDGSNGGNLNGTSNIWIINADGTGSDPLTELTALGADSFEPHWSPDNSKIAYLSSRALDGSDAANPNGTENIWVMNADGSNPAPLTQLTADGADASIPEWSPDGSQIIFDSSAALNGSDAANANFTRNIWMMNADGSNRAPLTQLTADQADAAFPQLSPDAAQILFLSSRALTGSDAPNTNNVVNVWVMDANGSNPSPLTQMTAQFVINNNARWSPDGMQIAFHSNRDLNPANDALNANGTGNIWVMDADSGNPLALTNLTADNAENFRPQWSPDGSQLTFVSQAAFDGSDAANINNGQNIWVMDSDGQNAVPLTPYTILNLETLEPEFSPDGSQIAFSSEGAADGSNATSPSSSPNIFIMDADGGNRSALTQIDADKSGASSPHFSN